MAPPPNPYFDQAKSLIDGYDGGAGGYREAHGRNINAINESGNEFFGGSTSDGLRDKVRQSRMFRNNQDLGSNLAQAKQDETQYKNAGYMSLGGATAPQLVQTGGTANNVQSGGFWAGMAQSAIGGAASGLAA